MYHTSFSVACLQSINQAEKENTFQVMLWETFNITASVYIRGNREGWTAYCSTAAQKE